MTSNCLSVEELEGLRGGALAAASRARVEAHLTGCQACQNRLRDLTPATVMNAHTAGAGRQEPSVQGTRYRDANEPVVSASAPGGHHAVLPGPVHGPRQPGWFDYELLAVLGKGGAGVVHRARQLSLGRTVAIKTLLCGRHADAEDRARFHAEAEAAARLSHPNIVQIYEIGENDGALFLSLEYVAGGSLADHLGGTPQPNRFAASLVATLAGAVQHAHDNGIVHRDLKPGNVLMADGVPKVTDFGLAKHLEREVTQTQTGAIMGSPSYMAPEQAQGSKDVGPPADIYALGAILYECLTGRPPFRADTPMNTVMQVRTEGPVPPRQLNPAGARDLETICLKCLQKDPARRYATARELGDDLGRWLAGEPIQARPVGWPERAWKWARRRPTTSALIALGLVAGLGLLATWGSFTARLSREQETTKRLLAQSDRYFDLAAGAVEDLLTDVAETTLADEPNMEEKRRILLEKALRYYQSFLSDRQDDHFRRQTARARLRVGRITTLLDRHREAQEACRDALTDLAGEEDPSGLQLQAECHTALGESLRVTGDLASAADSYRAAAALYDRLLSLTPGAPAPRLGRARCSYNLGIVAADRKQADEAVAHLREAVAALTALVADHPDPGHRQELGRAQINLGRVLRRSAPDGALAAYGAASELYGALARELGRPEHLLEQGVGLNNLGNVLRDRRRLADAEDAQRQAVGVFGRLAGSFPAVPRYRHEQANAHVSLGTTLAAGPRPLAPRALTRAREQFEAACALSAAVVADRPDMPDYLAGHALALGNLAWALQQEGELAGATCCAALASQRLHGAVTRAPDDARHRDQLHYQAGVVVNRFLDLGLPDPAAGLAAGLARLPCAACGDHYQAACLLARCAAALPADRPADRLAWLDRALELLGEADDGGFLDGTRLKRDLTGDLAPLQSRLALERLRRRLARP